MADDPEINKLKAEIKSLQEANAALTSDKGKAETAKTIAEAQRATILAQLPPMDTKPLEGKATVDATVTTEIQKLAQEALSEAAREMISSVLKALPNLRTVALYNSQDLSVLANYSTLVKQLKLLIEHYESAGSGDKSKMNKATEFAVAPLLVPAVASTAVKSVIDLISLFKTNVDIKGAPISFDDASLVAHVTKHFTAAGQNRKNGSGSKAIEIIYSELYLPGILSSPDGDESELLGNLQKLSVMRETSEPETRAFDAKSDDDKLLDPNKERIAQLKALNQRCDQLMATIGTIDDKQSVTAMTMLLRGEILSRRLQSNDSAILFVKATGGGENKTKQNLFRNAKVSHSGTAILTYLLFTIRDGLKLADVICRTKTSPAES